MASPVDIARLVFDLIGMLVSLVIAYPPIRSVWRLHQMADIGLARRFQCWLLALCFHSFTTIMIVVKDPEFLIILKKWKQLGSVDMDLHRADLVVKFLGPFLILTVSIILLGRLVKHYPITQDVLATWLTIGYTCVGYLSILFTDFVCFEMTVTLEIILIPVTICTHVFRFTTQGPWVQFEWVPFIFSVLGVISGGLCLYPLGKTFLENLKEQLAFKIATLVAAIFRILDVIAISCHTTREAANYFRSRLHGFFYFSLASWSSACQM